MELQQLQREVQKKLTGEIVQTNYWYIPVHTLNVSYQPIARTKMDILMKMILLSFKETTFKNAQEISDILLVEQLFIHDLMTKMEKTSLLTKVDDHFALTQKGEQQLQTGIFEEELPMQSVELFYSPVHQSIVEGDMESVLTFDDYPEQLYRHFKDDEQLTINPNDLVTHLQQQVVNENELEDATENDPVHIESIHSYETIQINDVPCIEFLVKEGDNEQLVAKVWNTLRNNWDRTIELDLIEKSK